MLLPKNQPGRPNGSRATLAVRNGGGGRVARGVPWRDRNPERSELARTGSFQLKGAMEQITAPVGETSLPNDSSQFVCKIYGGLASSWQALQAGGPQATLWLAIHCMIPLATAQIQGSGPRSMDVRMCLQVRKPLSNSICVKERQTLLRSDGATVDILTLAFITCSNQIYNGVVMLLRGRSHKKRLHLTDQHTALGNQLTQTFTPQVTNDPA